MADNYKEEPITQLTPCKELSKFMPMASKAVLEIGGNSQCISALPFIKAGASAVTVSGLEDVKQEHTAPHENIKILTADALKLREIFGDETFDIVYGVSILEHIPNPNMLFDQVFHVLRPGGMAYLQGSPLWSGAYGHHIWLDNWRHGTKNSYHFIPWPDSGAFNPIPDWGHLLYNRAEMAAILHDQRLHEADIPKIIHFIYDGDVTNKESASAIMAAASNSPFVIQSVDVSRYALPEATLQLLREKFPGRNEDWSITGIALVLMKPID